VYAIFHWAVLNRYVNFKNEEYASDKGVSSKEET